MLVTFETKSAPSMTCFGDVARELLRLMGCSGQVPGALLAADVPPALESLRSGLEGRGEETPPPDDEDAEPPVPLKLRAYPLIELLSSAADNGCDVTWKAT